MNSRSTDKSPLNNYQLTDLSESRLAHILPAQPEAPESRRDASWLYRRVGPHGCNVYQRSEDVYPRHEQCYSAGTRRLLIYPHCRRIRYRDDSPTHLYLANSHRRPSIIHRCKTLYVIHYMMCPHPLKGSAAANDPGSWRALKPQSNQRKHCRLSMNHGDWCGANDSGKVRTRLLSCIYYMHVYRGPPAWHESYIAS